MSHSTVMMGEVLLHQDLEYLKAAAAAVPQVEAMQTLAAQLMIVIHISRRIQVRIPMCVFIRLSPDGEMNDRLIEKGQLTMASHCAMTSPVLELDLIEIEIESVTEGAWRTRLLHPVYRTIERERETDGRGVGAR